MHNGMPQPPAGHVYKCVLCGSWLGMWHHEGCPLRKPSRYATTQTRETDFGTVTMVQDVGAMENLRKHCWTIRPIREIRTTTKRYAPWGNGIKVSEMIPISTDASIKRSEDSPGEAAFWPDELQGL